ncbi:hypothetical protein [Halocatena halophila]|uniref:hypothetical protein n=1 Tax=Halocatena halophila TaxID=2814576 RepID=UPI002ED05BDD
MRRLAIVLIAIGLVTSAIYATGAFDSFTASRNASVNVTGDATGYLGLQPADGPNGAYATDKNGKLQVSLSEMADADGGADGAGVNPGAETTVTNVFTITNQGPQPVSVWLAADSDAVSFERGDSGRSIETKAHAVELSPGKTVAVSLAIDTQHVDTGKTLDPMMTLHASTDVGGTSVDSGTNDESEQPSREAPDESDTEKESGGSNNQDGSNDEEGCGINLLCHGENAVESGGEFIHGVAKDVWETLSPYLKKGVKIAKNAGRELTETTIKMANKLMNSPIDVLREAAAGLVFGGAGMPGGAFTAKESNSPYYFLSWMGSTIIPIVDIFTGLRDLADNASQGKLIGAGLEVVGLIPAIGKGADVYKSLKIADTWVGKYASKAGDALRVLRDNKYIAKLGPENRKKLVNKFKGGSSTSKTEKISEAQMQRYIDAGYNPARVDDMVKNDKFTKSDMRILTGKNADLKRAQALRDKDVPVDDIRYYAENDVPLKKVDELKDKKFPEPFSREQIRTLMKNEEYTPDEISKLHGEGFENGQITSFAKKGLDPDSLKNLRHDEGLESEQIVTLIKKDVSPKKITDMKDEGWENDQLTTLARRDADIEQARKLEQDGLSTKEVTDIAKNIHSRVKGRNIPTTENLKKVNELKGRGYNAEQLEYITKNSISLTGTKYLDKYVSRGKLMDFLKAREGADYFNKCRMIETWRKTHQDSDDKVPTLPVCTAEIEIY